MERRQHLTSRVVLSQVFAPRARRGYDPGEVDAFLRDIADGVDGLNDEIETLLLQSSATETLPDLPPPPPAAALAAYEGVDRFEVVAAEPEPTPVVEPEPVSELVEPDDLVAELEAVEAMEAPEQTESAEIVLQMARETAERTLGEANRRADEIIADAAFRASEIQRDSDRKAFEAVATHKSELTDLEGQVTVKRGELLDLERSIRAQLDHARELGVGLIQLADDSSEDGVVVDLTESANRRPVRSLDD